MLEYVKQMRAMIGKKPLLLCGASVIFFNGNRQVLMLQRKDNGCWCFPGGGMELGETVEETAKREAFEETGLTANELELFGVFSGEELHYVYPNGDEVYIVDIVFTCSAFEGRGVLNEESGRMRFFDIDSIPEDISPPVVPVVKELKRRSELPSWNG